MCSTRDYGSIVDRRQDQLPASLLQHSLHRSREIQNEMEPIAYLLRLRGSERRALGIETATVARDCDDFGMLLEPFREALGGPVRKEIDDAAQVQIDQNGSLVLAFTPSPIVDAQVANRECGWRLRRWLANAAQNRVITGGDAQPGEKSLARQAAGHVAGQANDFCGPLRLPTLGARDTGQSPADLALTRNARVREKGLRMARGSCHRLQSLKQFRCKVFRSSYCTKTAEEPNCKHRNQAAGTRFAKRTAAVSHIGSRCRASEWTPYSKASAMASPSSTTCGSHCNGVASRDSRVRAKRPKEVEFPSNGLLTF
jgi:hypothetical protein